MTRSSFTPKSFLWVGCTIYLLLVFGCSSGDNAGRSFPITGINASPAIEQPLVQIRFSATVTSVSDPQSDLAGAVQISDPVDGSYLYNEDANDSHPAADHGHYVFNGAPFAMKVDIEDLRFESDPLSSSLSLHLWNNKQMGQQIEDLCRLTSAVNMDVLPGVSVSSIALNLVDDSATALSSDELTGVTLNFDDWPTACVVTITGASGWQIDAAITWISKNNFPKNDPKDKRRFARL